MRRVLAAVTMLAGCWLWGGPPAFRGVCLADGASDTGSPADGGLDGLSRPDSFQAFQMMGKVLFSLLLIIGLLYVVMKVLSRKNRWLSAGGTFRPLGGIPLGPNKSVQMIEIGESIYLVGVGENVQLIDKIVDEEEISRIKSRLYGGRPQGEGGLWRQLKAWRNRRTQAWEEADGGMEAAAFRRLLQEKLRQIPGRKERVEELLRDLREPKRREEE